jgi:exopolysaccharide production protein ExoZ
MERLHEGGFIEPIRELSLRNRIPVLGICLGAQLLGQRSEEGDFAGLGLLPFYTNAFDRSRLAPRQKVHHMSWVETKLDRASPLSRAFDTTPRHQHALNHIPIRKTMENNQYKSLNTLQVLRGLTALFVVFHHSARAFVVYRPPNANLPLPSISDGILFQVFGGIGVDIFFVISGFVMILVSGKYSGSAAQALNFMARRIIRIYPMYLFFSLSSILILLRYYGIAHSNTHSDLTFDRIFNSLLFIPTYDGGGSVSPILGVGWTLFYEMFFYTCFSIVIWRFPGHVVTSLTGLLLALVTLGNIVPMDGAVWQFLGNTISLEFVFGCFLGWVYLARRNWFAVHPLWFLGGALLLLSPQRDHPDETWRMIFWGIPAMLIVMAALATDVRGKTRWGSSWLTLGDASYVIYLVHMLVIYDFVNRLVLKIPEPISNGLIADAVVLVCVALSLVAGLMAHWLIDKPSRALLLRSYRKHLLPRLV